MAQGIARTPADTVERRSYGRETCAAPSPRDAHVIEDNNATPESDEVLAHEYRLAQAQRLLRFCREYGFDINELMAGRLEVDRTAIQDRRGKIVPEEQDFEAVRSARRRPSR